MFKLLLDIDVCLGIFIVLIGLHLRNHYSEYDYIRIPCDLLHGYKYIPIYTPKLPMIGS